jgi:hypothetical protein
MGHFMHCRPFNLPSRSERHAVVSCVPCVVACTPKRDTSQGIFHSIGIYAAWQQKQKQQISITRQNDKTLNFNFNWFLI